MFDLQSFAMLYEIFAPGFITVHGRKQLALWADKLNKPVQDQPILKLSFSNAWYAGFIDAEGCFTARMRTCKTSRYGLSLELSFEVSQKDPDILVKISQLFQLKKPQVYYDKSWRDRFCLGHAEKQNLIDTYLKRFQLKTSKKQSFETWAEILHLKHLKTHLPYGKDHEPVLELTPHYHKINQKLV